MAKQLVLSGNRVVAHGEDCFLAMGGTVICTQTGRVFQNATVAECDGYPSDIDSVGYEYHAGVFVPCAPYGKTNKGSVMLACDECGAPRSSDLTSENGGLHIPGVLSGAKMPAEILSLLGMTDGNLADAFSALRLADIRFVTGSYSGTGKSGSANKNSITFAGKPLLVIVGTLTPYAELSWSSTNGNEEWDVTSGWGNSFIWTYGMTSANVNGTSISISASGNTLSWYHSTTGYDYAIAAQLNTSGTTYKYAALIQP